MSKLYVTATTDAIKVKRTARAHHWAKAHVCGWTSGVRVHVYRMDVNTDQPKIKYEVYKTGGSGDDELGKIVAQWIEDE